MSDKQAFLENFDRILSQADRLTRVMLEGAWFTKAELAHRVGGSQHAMSARMSDLRRAGWTIQKRHAGNGLYLYRLGGQNQ